MVLISLLLFLFETYIVLSQYPTCDDSNANCKFHYKNGTCRLYSTTTNNYEQIADQAYAQIQPLCTAYWTSLYGTESNQKCTSSDKFIWPVGECGCPKCECPSTSFCCYDAPTSFDINYWDSKATLIECDGQYDMCYYSIDATGQTSISCSDKNALNTRLSLNVSSPLSTILTDNNNTACYTFVESVNSTQSTCFCGESGCNDVSNIIKPDLKPKNACYVSDSFHNEQFWSNYVYQDNECEMCGISTVGDKVEFSCKSRASCKILLSEYGEYNDELSGCVVTLNNSSECCCDPNIDGHLCNQKFLNTGQDNIASKTNFGCWKADFLTVNDDNWNSNAKRINCSYEYYKYCYIQSFGSNRYSSNCETETNCNNINNLENKKRLCCNGTDFCNGPSIFRTSSAPNSSVCLVIIWVLFSMF